MSETWVARIGGWCIGCTALGLLALSFGNREVAVVMFAASGACVPFWLVHLWLVLKGSSK